MEPAHYTDPLEEALSQASQRVAQLASLTGAMAQIIVQRRALHNARHAARDDERAIQVIDEQERLIQRQARLSWAPAHDAQWLAHADLLQTGRAWASAASYADTDPAAASAMRKCENRLRSLHPYAMARYDRLRDDSVGPLDAMQETVPLFGRSPHARAGDPGPFRPALSADAGPDATQPANQTLTNPPEQPPGDDSHNQTEERGQQIIERLQSSARAAGRPELGDDELAMILEAVTNLPEDMIERLTRNAPSGSQPGREKPHTAAAAPATDIDPATATAVTAIAGAQPTSATPGRSTAELAAESFPHTAADAIRAVSIPGTRNLGITPAGIHIPDRANRPGPSV